MDNLGIIGDRIVQAAKANPFKYGLVKQLGPFKPTQEDLQAVASTMRIFPRREEKIQPDATPANVKDELSFLPTLLGGGFSLLKGSVVDPPIYDARVTAPGQKMQGGPPLEGPGILSAIQSVVAGMTPGTDEIPAPGQEAKTGSTPAAPATMPDASKQVAPLTPEEIAKIKDAQEKIRSTQQTGFGTYYDPSKIFEVYNKMTPEEKTKAMAALAEWKKMSVEQRYREWINPNSIMRRIYTLYKGTMPAKYVSQLLDVFKELVEVSALFG